MLARSALIALVSSATYTAALSTSCTTKVGVLALGDLGSCLQLTSLLPVLSGSNSVVDSVDSYLKSLCADSTPTCSNDTLTIAQSSIDSGCSSDISDGGSSGTEVSALKGLLAHYTEFQAAACSTNTSTSDYCVTETLTTIQNAVGGNLTTSDVTSLLSGSSSSNSSIASVFTSGQLCTDCVNGMYYEALQANSSIADNIIGKGLTSKCGSDFGTKAPDTASSASSSSASSTSTSSSSSSAGSVATPFVGLLATAGIAGSVLGSLVFGTASVL
ncbi:hypothetical protein B9479_003358 [Cryptococcus floricola]|uniref:Uncharacterized protein n=1 Tax=Cryptococcus floricola TaxID=2591691 RepID=A0A5D3B0V1_9TREE|nr:hypothetical protein B9479_003358 [Cryptococcus floricola]